MTGGCQRLIQVESWKEFFHRLIRLVFRRSMVNSSSSVMTRSSLDVQLERTHRWNCVALIILFLQILRSTEAKVFATQMSPNIVETQYGKIRGILVTLPNRNLPSVEVYMGLQYASLLGGELRFMPPTSSMEKWESTRVAIRFRPVCPQKLWHMEQAFSRMSIGRVEHFKRILPFLEKQSEECLNLNLYVPVKGGKAHPTNHSLNLCSSSYHFIYMMTTLPRY